MSDFSLPSFIAAKGTGTLLRIVISPQAKRSVIVGPHADRLKVSISAPPVDGKANREVVVFFSKLTRIPKSKISLVKGERSREKTMYFQEIEPEELVRRLEIT